jgi:hypothetical protein
MWKEDKDLLKEIKKARKEGRMIDKGFELYPEPKPNEEINKAIGAPKGTIIKPVPMPEPKFDPDKEIDIGGMKIRRGDLKPVPMPMSQKKGGAIDLSKCKVNTAKKNSSSSKW